MFVDSIAHKNAPDCFLGLDYVLLIAYWIVQSENTLSLATAKLSTPPISKEKGGPYCAQDSTI